MSDERFTICIVLFVISDNFMIISIVVQNYKSYSDVDAETGRRYSGPKGNYRTGYS